MLGSLHGRWCGKLNYFLRTKRVTARFVDYSYVLPQKVTRCRSMSKDAINKPDSGEEKLKENGSGDDSSRKMTSRQRLSLVFAEYGITAVVFHTGISLTSLGLCYVAVSSGLDVPGFLLKIGFSENISQSIAAKGASTFVIAYACHKVFMPLRIFMTVTCTPIIVHRLRSLGLIK